MPRLQQLRRRLANQGAFTLILCHHWFSCVSGVADLCFANSCIENTKEVQKIVQLIICKFFCCYGSIEDRSEGLLFSEWVAEQLLEKLHGKISIDLHLWLSKNCTNIVRTTYLSL
jgi:hypothetical protein